MWHASHACQKIVFVPSQVIIMCYVWMLCGWREQNMVNDNEFNLQYMSQ